MVKLIEIEVMIAENTGKHNIETRRINTNMLLEERVAIRLTLECGGEEVEVGWG